MPEMRCPAELWSLFPPFCQIPRGCRDKSRATYCLGDGKLKRFKMSCRRRRGAVRSIASLSLWR
jgi:hypothetical protein